MPPGLDAASWRTSGATGVFEISEVFGDVLKVLVHVVWGLRYLHSRGVVRGDLEPEDVIVVVSVRLSIWRR